MADDTVQREFEGDERVQGDPICCLLVEGGIRIGNRAIGLQTVE